MASKYITISYWGENHGTKTNSAETDVDRFSERLMFLCSRCPAYPYTKRYQHLSVLYPADDPIHWHFPDRNSCRILVWPHWLQEYHGAVAAFFCSLQDFFCFCPIHFGSSPRKPLWKHCPSVSVPARNRPTFTPIIKKRNTPCSTVKSAALEPLAFCCLPWAILSFCSTQASPLWSLRLVLQLYWLSLWRSPCQKKQNTM